VNGDALAVLTLSAGYNTAVVVVGTACLGIAAGTIGTFLLLRRRALVSDALSHSTLPGIALAFLIATWLGFEGRSLPVLLTGALASGVLGVLAIQAIARYTRLSEDAAIGAVLSVFFGAGVVLLSHIQTLETGARPRPSARWRWPRSRLARCCSRNSDWSVSILISPAARAGRSAPST
jgi:manganese/zinc/iron transport system permease protein